MHPTNTIPSQAAEARPHEFKTQRLPGQGELERCIHCGMPKAHPAIGETCAPVKLAPRKVASEYDPLDF